MHYLKKLKSILQYDYIFYILLIISIIYTLICIKTDYKSIYNENYENEYGYVLDYKITDDKISLLIKSKEKLIINYYYKNKEEIENISYADYIYVKGKFEKPSNNTNFNLFNYRKYLLSKKVKYIVNADTVKLVYKNTNLFYKIKVLILNRINKCSKSSNYIKAFIFADKNYISDDIYKSYQSIGITHLFSVSGMHVTLISLILFKLLFFLKENKRFIIVSIFLFLYLFLTNFTISILRSFFQFILFNVNKIFRLKIKTINIVIFIFSLMLLYNPYYVYNVGFLFSFVVSFGLIKFSSLIINKKGIYKLLIISLISFLISIPILINNFYKINVLSIIYNIFYVPIVSWILFPFSILTALFPFLDDINYTIITIFEHISKILSNVNIFTFSVAKLPIVFIIIYYYFVNKLFENFNFRNLLKVVIIVIVFVLHKMYLFFPEITYIDVGQGDSTIIRINNKNILIDTGGKINYNICENILIPYFRSIGVKKIDYLILTHGDFDHMGEAINLVNKFKVGKVIFNNGEYNDLEKKLIKNLKNKNIKYYKGIDKINVANNELYFLNTKQYNNENDNSNVIYFAYNDYKFLFMADAGIIKEEDILKKYNLKEIDFYKVGHHGSNTSTSKKFIKFINPKYSLISVGKNNIYGHPNKKVLDTLSVSKVYRTDKDGSIRIKFTNDSYDISTCNY